ncbi:hypothetical protein Pfo_017812 [Paulownia fortunei]|nr:hypothetical protein Pfo_017812 [Paulownia fortunei]
MCKTNWATLIVVYKLLLERWIFSSPFTFKWTSFLIQNIYGQKGLKRRVRVTSCTDRCSKTSFKKPCMLFCQKCCAKCLCVPPGTYGNKQVCPCYNDWKTKRGGPKCP